MAARETAIVFGVGPGLGWALAKRFMGENMQVCVVARDEAKLNSLIESDGGHGARPYAADVSNSEDVQRVFESIDRDFGEPDLVVFNAGAFQKGNVLDIDPADFERCWRIGCPRGTPRWTSGRATHGQARAWDDHIQWRDGRPARQRRLRQPGPFRNSACGRSRKAWPVNWDPRACISAS